jgi:holo-[acyl-carrier protein] synthase
MIQGIGTDIIEVSRIQSILDRNRIKPFLERILTKAEHNLAEHRQQDLAIYVAGRFAAKEAVAKALGCGIGAKVSFQDIEITPDALGKPFVHLSKLALKRCELSTSTFIHLSISHTHTQAIAFVVIEHR